MTIYNWLLIIIGLGITIDGLGSVIIKSGQYHSAWFDGERYARALAGVAIMLIGLFGS